MYVFQFLEMIELLKKNHLSAILDPSGRITSTLIIF